MTPALLDETLRYELWCDVVVALEWERLDPEEAVRERAVDAVYADTFEGGLPRQPRLR